MRVNTSPLREVAEHFAQLAREVGARVLELQGGAREFEKNPGDLVTEADRLSHELLCDALSERYPGVPLVMEEQENTSQVPEHCIVVDELDGTNIFARGAREFGLTMALIEAGRPSVGVLHQPARGQTIVAVRGAGAYLNGARIELDRSARLENQLIVFEVNRYLPERSYRHLTALSKRALAVRCFGTAVGGAIEVLRGRAATYINWRGAKVWDFAAAALAVEEAGGCAQTCTGEPLAWDQLEVSAMLAANPEIATAALGCIPP